MSEDEFERFDRWHVLFDELCDRAGFHDAASLAARYCDLTGGGRKEHETAVRNLNNWRSGRHIPRMRSLKILEQVLGMNEDPAMLARWNALYRQANEAGEDSPAETRRPASRREMPFAPASAKSVAAAALIFCLGIAIGNVWGSGWRPWGGPADDAPMVVYTPEVFMSVGESKVIHAERGNCGELPRDWKDLADYLPPSALGTFSDGGLAQRNSMFCKGRTPARAIVFTATKPGVEEFTIQGDFLKVTIAEAEQP